MNLIHFHISMCITVVWVLEWVWLSTAVSHTHSKKNYDTQEVVNIYVVTKTDNRKYSMAIIFLPSAKIIPVCNGDVGLLSREINVQK